MKAAIKACVPLAATAAFDDCVADLEILDDKKLVKEIVKGYIESEKKEKEQDEKIQRAPRRRPKTKKKPGVKSKHKRPDCKKFNGQIEIAHLEQLLQVQGFLHQAEERSKEECCSLPEE